MAKDYAGRTARGRGTRRKPAPAKKPFPWVIALSTVALICLFGYILLSIRGASDGTPEPVNEPASAPKVVREPDPLPEKPEETWDYMETLPNSEVEVDVEEQASQGPYQMQCGSFRTEGQANSMKATIAFQGIESQVRRTEGRNGVWYRVVLGPFERKRAAEKQRHSLQKAGINTCQIWKWQ